MQLQEYVIQIEFEDRPGFGFDVFELFEKHGLDKTGLEVPPTQTAMIMAIKFRCAGWEQAEKIRADLLKINGVLSVKFRDYMPYEAREQQLQTILNAVNEGVVAIDKDGILLHANDKACSLFHCDKQDLIGMHAGILFSKTSPLFEALQTGRLLKIKEQKLIRQHNVIHFFMTCTPVIDIKGHILGVVATINDYRQVEEIMSKINRKWDRITFDHIVHQSSKMRQIIETAKVVAKGNSSILLRGESGTGKELFAKAIHAQSNRTKQPFIAINCAALPDTLLESELFGYEEGAFTGASKGGKKGVFEQAASGTLFLDEIGEISPQMQVRLLRVLQEHAIRRVGGYKELPIDVRIIAATNRNLEEMMKQGLFREDLYYRLNVIPLNIPPLRERKEDIPLIAQHLIQKICFQLNKPAKHVTKESLELLMSQNWPGNVRQLANTLEMIINLTDSEEIRAHHFQDWANLQPPNIVCTETNILPCEIRIPLPTDGKWPPLKTMIREIEKEIVNRVLSANPSSRKAGKILGVSNTTILNKIGKLETPTRIEL
jgi:transcriptional regulator of aroF, aroG, tyrA and aromatic amino acid transport